MSPPTSFRPVTPAEGPAWLPRFASSISDLFRRIMPQPLRLKDYATADLPPAADFKQGLAYDSNASGLVLSDGSGWRAFAFSDHVHAAAEVAFAPAGGVAATDVQAAIAELDSEKAAASHAHAIAEVTGLEAALDAKEGTIAAGTAAHYWRGDKSFRTLDKAAVGLGQVDDTADAEKPVSAAQQAALDLKASLPEASVKGFCPIISTARYLLADGQSLDGSTGSMVSTSCRMFPFQRRAKVTDIAFEVTIAGAAGTKARVGIYRSTAEGLAGELLLDCGEVAVVSIGIKEVSVGAPFVVEEPVWLAMQVSDSITVRGAAYDSDVARLMGVNNFSAMPSPAGGAGGFGRAALQYGGWTYGPFPADMSGTVPSFASTVRVIAFKAATS